MSPKLVFYGLATLLLAALVGCGYLFWIQNSATTVMTSFEFWGLGRRGHLWSITDLILLSGGVGFVLGAIPFGVLWFRKMGEARRLRKQIAIGSNDSSFR